MNNIWGTFYHEYNNQSRKLYNDLISPLLALRLLVEDKPLKGLNEKENLFLKTVANKIVDYIEEFRRSNLKTIPT